MVSPEDKSSKQKLMFMQILHFLVIKILGKSFGKKKNICRTQVMGSTFIEPVPRYKLFNRTHALLQGYEFSRMQVLQGMSSPADTGWGYKLGEQFFVQQSVCTCTCRFKTQKLQCYHLFILGSIYTLLNRPDIFVLDIKMLL